ncbi:acyltransferase family protein [Aliarcobacter butzleri]|uniref:acyltransferase family protein n=1 Tax=Aliarcobacter butzleri TaxID=28197 RepID=UPI002876A714|nr:acyltransferase [Aliarcobacter butzleri]MDS1315145.1 acyltransferase [Aliarcobacter butzleri]
MISTKNNFDILRLVLAILVYFAHWNTLSVQNIEIFIFKLSGFAVDMFFVVSGFLIFWSYENDQNNKNFYIKRFFRIFPLYAFLIVLQTLFFIGFSDEKVIEIVKYFVVNMFFLNFLAPSVGYTFSGLEVNAINGSLWTLKNEVAFYVIVPLIFMLYKRFGIILLLIMYILSVIYMFIVNFIGMEKLLVQFPAQLRLFLVGIICYIIFKKFNKNNIYLAVLISFLLVVLFKDIIYFKYMIYPMCIGIFVMFCAYFIKYIKVDFDFSYSFYILHFPVIQLALYFGINPTNPIISFLTLFIVILTLSYLSEKYIEKKFIKIGKDIIKRNTSAR